MSRITGDSACPKCKEMGRDKGSNHLIHFEDGGMHCPRADIHADGKPYTVKPNGDITEDYEDNMKWNQYTVADVLKLPVGSDPARKIGKETNEHFRTRVEYNTITGEVDKVFYPYIKEGKAVGYKVRKHFEEGDREVESKPELLGIFKCFRAIGDVKGVLYNQHQAGLGGKRLLITEGEEDAAAAYEMLSKYNPKVVSIPSGATINKEGKGVLDKGILENIDFINSFEEVYVCFDNDKAGLAITEELATLIGPAKIKHVKLSEKDASDMLTKGKQPEFVNSYFSAKRYTPNGIVEGGIGLDVLLTPIQKGVMIPVLPGTSDKLKGFREAELTLVLAPAGVGKTTVSKEIGYALNRMGKKIVHVFLEEDLKKTQQSYIAMDNNVHLAKFRRDPSIISREAAEKSYNELVEGQLYLDHWGSMSPEEVMKDFRYGASWGAQFGILDHISMVFSGNETTNERKDIDMLLTDMAAFTRESRMHLIVISHIKRSNKPFRKKEDYPYWETVASDAGRGSGAFEQLADNIITLEVEYLDEDFNKGRIRTRVAKNREESVLGVGDVLNYCLATGRIEPEITRF